MPYDIKLFQNRDIGFDNGGDLALANGKELMEQSVYLAVSPEARDYIGEKLTAANVRLLQERIREELDNDEYLGDVIHVTVQSFNEQDGSVSVTAEVRNGDTVDLTI